jgi:hypothetical protein
MNGLVRSAVPLAFVATAAIALPAVVAIGATACRSSSTPVGQQSQSAAGQRSACADLGGTSDAKGICRANISGHGYEIRFTFPVDYPDQKTLSDYLTHRREEFIGVAAERLRDGRPYELDTVADAYHSGTAASGTKSLVFKQYSDSGGAHPTTNFQAFTYDQAKGAAVTLDTLFKRGVDPVAVLDPIVRREFEKVSDDYGPVGENTLGASTYQNFALTDDAVIFFIGQGQWLPQAAGPRKVSVLRTDLESLLA